MKSRQWVGSGLMVGLLTFGASGCGRQPDIGKAPRPPQAEATAAVQPSAASEPSKSPIRDTIVKLLASSPQGDPFPSGTRLLSANLTNGVATLDFSPEFDALADSGETTESNAQKALRAALAPFATVEKMRVTVAGKPFPSQATDWTTPFPVRDADVKEPRENRR